MKIYEAKLLLNEYKVGLSPFMHNLIKNCTSDFLKLPSDERNFPAVITHLEAMATAILKEYDVVKKIRYNRGMGSYIDIYFHRKNTPPHTGNFCLEFEDEEANLYVSTVLQKINEIFYTEGIKLDTAGETIFGG